MGCDSAPGRRELKLSKWRWFGLTLRKPVTNVTRLSLEWNPQEKWQTAGVMVEVHEDLKMTWNQVKRTAQNRLSPMESCSGGPMLRLDRRGPSQSNTSIVFIFVSCEGKDYYRVVLVGQFGFACRSCRGAVSVYKEGDPANPCKS